MKGKNHSEETKKKMSESSKNIKEKRILSMELVGSII
jgi:hypothetical protein